MGQLQTISRSERLWLWGAAWLIAGLATAILDPVAVLFAWAFPSGLFRFIISPDSTLARDLGPALLVAGWILYASLTTFGFAPQNSRRRFFTLYAVLCAFLALNVVGCHVMMGDPVRDSL
jgi:hypothetical protein